MEYPYQPPVAHPIVAHEPPPAATDVVSTPKLEIQSSVPTKWSTGLCDCFSDTCNCFFTCWCPCITFGQVAEIIDRGSISCGVSGGLYALILYFTGCARFYSLFYRSKMRALYMLPGNFGEDILIHCCCEPCSLCQMYRELQHRGFDMNLGYHGSVERENRRLGMTSSPYIGGMTR